VTELICKDCGWIGEDDELVDETDDDKFNQCPKCHSENVIDEDAT